VWDASGTFESAGVGFNPLAVNKWYLLAGIAKIDENIMGFQNGVVLHGGIKKSIGDTDNPLGIGNWYSELYDGKLATVMIFSRALSIDELNALCNLFGTC